MLYMIKRVNNDSYFNKNIGFQNHWTYKDEGKTYYTMREVKKDIKKYNIKNVEVIKI